MFDRVEFIPLELDARAGGHRRARRPRAAEGHRRRRAVSTADELRQAANYLNSEFSGLPLHRAREAVLERMNEERLLYDALMARAMRLASSTFTDLPEERDAVRRRRRVAARRRAAADAHDAAARCWQMIEEKQRLVRLLERIHRRPGTDGRHRRRASRSESSPVQPRGLDLRRWHGHRNDRRDRADPHALLAGDRGRRRRGAGGVPRAARSQLGRTWLRNTWKNRRTRRLRRLRPMRRKSPKPRRSSPPSSASATTSTIGCCARPRSSTTTASASSASAASRPTSRSSTCCSELLLVVDDFDLALTVEAGEEAAAYRKGVELIHAKLHDLLRKQGVRPIEALGADFDPNLHQAVMHEAESRSTAKAK